MSTIETIGAVNMIEQALQQVAQQVTVWSSRLLFSADATGTPEPTPEPTPSLREGLDPLDVSPGVLGFVVTFIIAGALIFLGISMTKRLRRIRHREETEAAARKSSAAAQPGDDDNS